TERLGASLNATLTSMTTGITSRQLEKSLESLSTFPTERLESILNSFFNSSVQEVKIPNGFIRNLKTFSAIDISVEDIDTVTNEKFEEDEHLSIINQGIETQSTLEWINIWCKKIIDFPTKLKEKQPALYLLYYIFVSVIIWNLVLLPVLQDSMKNQVFNKIEVAQENPNKNIKELKKSLSNELEYEFGMINSVRVTNRPTVVYYSNKRRSGASDTILSNKPVIILIKKKNWSYVLYKNRNEEEVMGWVFTKNLAK
uniref:hypothetical protein n=1 Tax=Priestia flexa TaxID=86664 RepID=UPI001CFD81ED